MTTSSNEKRSRPVCTCPETQEVTHPESGVGRALSDCASAAALAERGAVPDRARDPSGESDEEPGRQHPCRPGLRAGLDDPAKARLFPLLRWWRSPSSAARLKMPAPRRRSSRIQIAGLLLPPGGKRAGSVSATGAGLCAWSWATPSSRRRRARPSVLQPLPRRQPRRSTPRLPHRALDRQSQASPGNETASPVEMWFASPLARSAVPPASS